jgi:hypothetical protein
MEFPLLKVVQDSQTSQASVAVLMLKQLIVLASILAQVVFPTPLGPQNKKAWARWLFLMAFFKVVVMGICPTTVSKVAGRYLRAETMKFSIRKIYAPNVQIIHIFSTRCLNEKRCWQLNYQHLKG